MSASRRRGAAPVVHLFVGLHKTGSSAIRFMLDLHAGTLDRHGFHLPRASWTRYINRFWNGGHNNVPWEVCGHHPVLPEFGTMDDLLAEIQAAPDHQHIVFSEDLDYLNGAQVAALAARFAACDVRIVVFLRNQVDWLQSHYTEEHKWFTPSPSADWFLERIEHDRRLHLDALCIRWARPFGNRITIRCYEDIRERVFDAFLECCDAPPALRAELASRSLPLVNASPGPGTLALIRQASAYAAEQGVRPEYFNAAISSAVVTAAAAFPRDRRSIPMSADARGRLQALMTRVNRELANAFGLTLGDTYWTVPEGPDSVKPVAPALSTAMLVEMCLEFGIRAGTRLRALEPHGLAHASLADAYYPWVAETGGATAAVLDELLDSTFASDDAALYLERQGENAAAFRQADGQLTELRRLRAAEWKGLILAVQHRARLNRVSWNNLREGHLVVAHGAVSTPMWVRHVPTTDGELVMIEPVGRWAGREQP